MTDFFEDIKEKAKEKKTSLDKKSAHVSYLRLATFISGVIFIYQGMTKGKDLYTALGAALILSFVILIRFHGLMEVKAKSLDKEIECADRYIARITGGWRDFGDDGSEFISKDDTLSHDIDLLGKGSMYQLISVAHTQFGRKRLAETLCLKNVNIDEASERYEAVRELSEDKEFLVGFEAVSSRIYDKKDEDEEQKNYDYKPMKFPFWMGLIMAIVPVLNIAAIVLTITGQIKATWIIVTFLLGIIAVFAPQKKVESLIMPVYLYGLSSRDFYDLLKMIGEKDFSSRNLKSLKERVIAGDGMLKAVKSLGAIGQAFNVEYNAIVHMLLAGFFGYDLYIALAAVNWNNKYGSSFSECFSIIGSMEEYLSLSVLSVIRNVTPFEMLEEGDNRIVLSDVVHPLLDTDKVVSNTVSLDNSVTVITGSNMSGKTTFLRTVAVNLVMGYIGAGVCAKEFKAPKMKIFTSMRVMDDVTNGISTFYAEILRIKDMSQYIKKMGNVPALCLIDEIFKGTNSADRIYGAAEAIKNLSSGNAMVIVSTHDFELCELKKKNGDCVSNYHFEEYYEDNELKFDYKIKEGRCTTRNAKALLSMAGLLELDNLDKN